MSALNLDPLGMCLLRELYEARESMRATRAMFDSSIEEYARNRYNEGLCNERRIRDDIHHQLRRDFFAHLRFIHNTPEYAEHLTYSLHHYGALYTRDVMKIVGRSKTVDVMEIYQACDMALEFYEWYIQFAP